MQQLFTVDQIAQMFNLHPRTIRRFIRENKLNATKVGGEWRIRREDVEMFAGNNVQQIKATIEQEVTAFIDGETTAAQGKYLVCAVLDCYVDTPEAVKLSQIVMWHMNEPNPERGQAKCQYVYDDQKGMGRYILWGNPTFVGKILTAVSEGIKE